MNKSYSRRFPNARKLLSLAMAVLVCSVLSCGFDSKPEGQVKAQRAEVTTEPEILVWRVFPDQDNPKKVRAIVTVDSEFVNPEGVGSIARSLNRIFESYELVKVGILVDKTAARLVVEGKVNYPTYENAEKGRYDLDRRAKKETIEYLHDGKKTMVDLSGAGNSR